VRDLKDGELLEFAGTSVEQVSIFCRPRAWCEETRLFVLKLGPGNVLSLVCV
jgi:hypothetical protein